MRGLLPSAFGRRAALALAFGAFMLAFAGNLFAAGFVGQLVKTLGDVHITRDGASLSAGPGTALELGDVIKTGPGARLRLRFVDGSILTLGENTSLSIDIFAVDPGNSSRTVVLTLLSGIVNTAAAKSGENQFDYQIKTPNAYSAVRGTKWIVNAPKGTTDVYVLNGTVELGTNAGQKALVNAGSWGSVNASGKLSPITPTTPAMLQPLIDATSDGTGGSAPLPPATTPQPAPIQLPSLPLPAPAPDDGTNPATQRALKNNNRGGRDTGGGKDHTY